jgi:hypothetical protein
VIIGGRVYVFDGNMTFEDVTPFFPDSLGPVRGGPGAR